MTDYPLMNQALYEGRAPLVKEMTEKAIAEGLVAQDVMQDGLIAGMSVVGEDFKHNRLYVPQVLIAARAMKAGMSILEPILKASGHESAGTIVIGTVKGDLHDIGKNLVKMMAEGAGFTVVDIGVDQPAEQFLAAVREHDAGILGMSALLTTTMPYMKTVIDALHEEESLEHVKVCVGGAPVSEMFAEEIGADGYGADASRAVELFKELYPVSVN